jgi:hypothetical protein
VKRKKRLWLKGGVWNVMEVVGNDERKNGRRMRYWDSERNF